MMQVHFLLASDDEFSRLSANSIQTCAGWRIRFITVEAVIMEISNHPKIYEHQKRISSPWNSRLV
jgi:hypothetical protein